MRGTLGPDARASIEARRVDRAREGREGYLDIALSNPDTRISLVI